MFRSGPGRVFQELRRRRVFNTIAIYIVGAWVALQVTELALPALDIPEQAIRYVWLGAFLLFPLVLVFGWRYDISKAGIRRTAPSGAAGSIATPLHRPDHWFIGTLGTVALVVVSLVLIEISQVEPEDPSLIVPQENSIAVMPFGVCEDRVSDLPLASGLTSEVINRLAARDRLKVTGRTTSFNLAGVGSSNQQIAELAGTRYVLNGIFCREGLGLTLEAELTNREGFIQWRDRFTQTANRFDQIEQQLATLVANGVALELGDVIQGRPDDPVKRQALEQLLIGQEYYWNGETDQAREAFTRALEYQPDYAEAVWGLAMLEVDDGDLFDVGSSIEKFWPLGEKALDLAMAELERGVPDFKAHWVAGRILHTLARLDEDLTWRKANELSEEEIKARKAAAKAQFKEAEQHFRSAIILNPSEYLVRNWLATNLDRQGVHRGAEALEILLEGQDLDPFNPGFARNLANRLTQRGQYRQAMELLDRFNALPVEKRRPLYWMRLEIMNNLGRTDEKLAAHIEILETDAEAVPGSGVLSHLWWTVAEIAELGLHEEAEQLYRQVAEIPFPEEQSWGHEFFFEDMYLEATGRRDEVVDKYLARISGKSDEEILDAWYVEVERSIWTFWDAGEQERAIRLYEALRHNQHAPTWAERQTWASLFLAQMYREVGREAEVPVLLNEVVEYLETELDSGIRHPFVISTLAEAYALQGNNEDALETLRLAVDYGYCWLPIWMKDASFTSNWWDPFMDNPDFLQSMDRMQACVEQQASNIRNLLDRYDMEELLVPVIEAAQRTGTSQP